jgi:hypothetical protein
MKGGKFFHRCKTFSVQRNLTLTHAGNIPGKITRFDGSKTWLQTAILPFFPYGNTHQFSHGAAAPRFTTLQVKGNKKTGNRSRFFVLKVNFLSALARRRQVRAHAFVHVGALLPTCRSTRPGSGAGGKRLQ